MERRPLAIQEIVRHRDQVLGRRRLVELLDVRQAGDRRDDHPRRAERDASSSKPATRSSLSSINNFEQRLRELASARCSRQRTKRSSRDSPHGTAGNSSNTQFAAPTPTNVVPASNQPLRRIQPPQFCPPKPIAPTNQQLRHSAAPTAARNEQLAHRSADRGLWTYNSIPRTTDSRTSIASYISAVSIHSVTGPSFTSDTCMCSRNTPVATSTPAARTRIDKRLVQPLGQLRRRRVGEARPPPSPAIAVERELAHHQHRPAHFGQRPIHLPRSHPQTPASRRSSPPANSPPPRRRRAQRPAARPARAQSARSPRRRRSHCASLTR